MTRNVFTSVGSRMWAAGALVAAAALSAAVVLAQTPAAGTVGDQKAMMAAADQKLTDLVARMNAARGEEKVTSIAAVVNELVVQRRQMHEQMRMQTGMMEQMMSRMSAMHGGAMMNKAPEPAKDATDADHATHHPEK